MAFGVTTPRVSLWTGSRGADEPELEAALPATIGVFGYMTAGGAGLDPTVFAGQTMYNTQGAAYAASDVAAQIDWPTEFPDCQWAYWPLQEWEAGESYRFGAYGPVTPGITAVPDQGAYTTFHALMLEGVPRYSAHDMVVTESVVERQCSSPSGNAKVSLAMRHVQARLRFLYRVDSRYDDLRTIRVTGMQIHDDGGRYSVLVDYSTAPAGVFPTPAFIPEADAAAAEPSALALEAPAGNLLLSTTLQPLASAYAAPTDNPSTFTITVTYDTLDKAEPPTVTRTGVTVTSTITVDKPLVSGCYYDINILVAPRYLYVLSDHDPDPSLSGIILID